jgi:hypothetical protein
MTDVQEAFWKGLTDQRVARMWAVADDWDDLSHDAKEFLRSAKPETLKFLKDARETEIKELENGIELVRSFKTTGRVLKWAIISTANRADSGYRDQILGNRKVRERIGY